MPTAKPIPTSSKAGELPRRDRLSWHLVGMALLLLCAIGVLLSLAQILLDSRTHSAEMDRDTEKLLALVREPASEAVYNIDDRLARRVLDGVFGFDGITRAELLVGSRDVLATQQRAISTGSFRFVTNMLFGERRDYLIDLLDPSGKRIGSLSVVRDTYPPGRTFLQRAGLVILTDILRAGLLVLVLLLVFHWYLTRPLGRMAHELAAFDPSSPESVHLPTPPGHERDELGLWVRLVNGLLGAIRDNLARRAEAESRAVYLEHFDVLSGLANRRLFLAHAGNALVTAGEGQVAVLIADVRDFRDINGQYGVGFGDELLRDLSQRISALGGPGTMAGRIAGNSFALLLSSPRAREHAQSLADAILLAFAAPIALSGRNVPIVLNIGIAVFPDDAQSAEQLVQNAERALAFAKHHGPWQFYQAQQDNALQSQKRLVRELHGALARGEISLRYQPLVAVRTGKTVAVEALIRWRHPELGEVSPADFIPLAENSGHIQALGEWVLRRACLQVAAWQKFAPLRLAVNVSAAQLLDGPSRAGSPLRERSFELLVAEALHEAKLAPELLELEITETAIIENMEQAIGTLTRLRASGVRISIDDFGTGHASLSNLKRLPIDQLKIDSSFVRDLLTDPGDSKIVKAIINLGRNLDLEIVAEGVEDLAQRDFLTANHCDLMQGYLFMRPLDEPSFAAWFKRQAQTNSVVVPFAARSGPG